MNTQFRKVGSESAITGGLEIEIKPIGSEPVFADVPRETSKFSNASRRPYVNHESNSRTSNSLGNGQWHEKFSVSVDPNLHPTHIVHFGERILIQGEGPWQLFDAAGEALAAGYAHNSDLYLSPEAGVFIYANDSGMIMAHDLENGRLKYSISLYLGGAFYRIFLALDGHHLLSASVEQEIDQDNEEKPYRSMIERVRLDQPMVIDRDGVLQSTNGTGTLIQEDLVLNCAADDGATITATRGRINVFRGNMELATSLVGAFNPVALSLGANENIYIVVSEANAYKLRAINYQGKRLFSTLLPYTDEYRNYPPIISYNNDVFILAGKDLLALDRSGYPKWEYRSNFKIAGAIVTPENDLIVTSGPELGVFDRDGNFRLLYKFREQNLRTPPALTERGELLVATDKKVYCLSAKNS